MIGSQRLLFKKIVVVRKT